MIKRTFALYPEETHFWSFQDYGTVIDVMARLKPQRVLEFGPGASTLALVEGGAKVIDTCEDDPEWFTVYAERLGRRFPGSVRVRGYHFADPIVVDGLTGERFDFALIDGPHRLDRRRPALAFALVRCSSVLIPTEDFRPGDASLREMIKGEARLHNFDVEWMETGPHSGGFALLTKRAE